jgi:uracil-DNA glycosylase family 4
LKAEQEIREIFGQLKNLILAHQEMGMEPPPVAWETRNDFRAEASGARGSSDPLRTLHSLEALQEHIGDCQRCRLHRGRTRLVFGEGSSQARLVFVGEAPGHDEDLAGRPFVGEAGKLLTRIIENGMGIGRESVYICNVVKCRPPGNRDPEPDEIETCIPFLRQQLHIIRPEVICTLGRIAGQSLMGEDFKITAKRGTWQAYMGIALMPTYHPAYLLRNPAAKRQVWGDIQGIMIRLGLEVKKNV